MYMLIPPEGFLSGEIDGVSVSRSLGLFDITISFGIGLFNYLTNHKTDGYKMLSNGNTLRYGKIGFITSVNVLWYVNPNTYYT